MSGDTLELYLASLCYGGAASTAHMRSILRLRSMAGARGVGVRLDLGGGEALSGRGRAAAVAGFLKTSATHLLLTDGASAFAADAVLGAVGSGDAMVRFGDRNVLVTRATAQQMSEVEAVSRAALGDLRAADRIDVALLFESLITPVGYVTDLDAFCGRWRELGGEISNR